MPINWDQAESDLGQLLAARYPALVERAYTDAEADLGRTIPRDAQAMDRLTAGIADRVAGITATQRERIAGLVQQYADDRAGLVAALQGLGDSIAAKAEEIAQTEVWTTMNLGTVLASRGAGLTHVYVTDGDGDPACASVHGTTQTLEWAEANPLGHPRCRRAFLVSDEG